MADSDYQVRVTLTNETDGHMFAEFAERIDEYDLTDDGKPDFGDLYRALRSEYGRCQSSVYIDVADGPPRRIGWYFLSRQQYTDTNGTYLRGAWCVVEHLEAPAQPARVSAVEIP